MGKIPSSYLINFATTGDPNGTTADGKTLPEWSAAEGSFIVLGIGKEISEFSLSDSEVNFWNYYISSVNIESASEG